MKTSPQLLYTFNKVVVSVNRIRELRLLKGMQQEDLARLLSVTRVSISRYETGAHDIDSETILRLCEIFDCSADYLLGRSPLPSPELTPEEEDLLLSWRRATPEIRAIVETALAPYREEDAAGASAPTA